MKPQPFGICHSDIGYALTRTTRPTPTRGGGGHGALPDAPTATEPPPAPWSRRKPRPGLLYAAVAFVALIVGGAMAAFGVLPVLAVLCIGGLFLLMFATGFLG